MATTQRSNIEVFFRVLGAENLRRQMQRVSQAGIATGRQLGNFGAGIGSALDFAGQKAIQLSRTLAVVGAVGFGALAKGIQDTTNASAELTSTVLALRAVNGEISKASGLPRFRATADGNLIDENSGGARKSAANLAFIQNTADRTGASILNLSRQFVQLNASASAVGIPVKNVENLFTGVTSASNVLGVSSEQTSRAFVALTQIASKGCHAPGTLILMSDYSEKLVEEVVVGDELMGPDGNPRRVLRLAHGTQDMFRVIPSNKMCHPFVVNLDHKLRLATALYGVEFTIEMSAYLLLPQEVRDELFLINRHHINQHVSFTVEPVGCGEFYGFQIEGDHLYLDAQGFEHHNTVAAEELRGQLSEALPGAIPLAAKAYRVSVKQFLDAVAKGNVDAASFIKKFGDALNKEYSSAADEAANTTRVALGRLRNEFFLARVQIGNGALDQEFKRIIDAANELFDTLSRTGAFARFGVNLANALRPLADRFEAAVRGGFDFEVILDALAGAASGIVRGFLVLVSVSRQILQAFSNLKDLFEDYGFSLEPIGDLIIGVADAFRQLSEVLSTRNYSGNGFIDFFASVYFLIEQIVIALARLLNPQIGPGIQSLEQAFARVARFINQAALAVQSLSTGQIAPGLDEEGQGILVWLALAVDRARLLQAAIKEAYALLSGAPAPQGADVATQQRFATRDAVGDLFAGRENVARVDEQGNTLYDPRDLDILFIIRDTIDRIVNFIVANKGAFAAVFDGAADTIQALIDIIGELSKVLDPVAQALGFEDLNIAIGYAIGFLFVMGRVAAIIALIRGAILAMVGALSSFAAVLGLTMPQFLVIAAAVGLIAFGVGKIVSNWQLLKDEVGNIITLIGAGLTDVLANVIRQLANLLSYLPGIGGFLDRELNQLADKLNEGTEAAREFVNASSLEATSRRQVENGGKDPFSDAGPNGFDAFSFLSDSGLTGMVSDLGDKQDETNRILDGIAQQNAAGTADQAAMERQIREAAANAAGGTGPAADFSRPVIIYLSDGSQIEMRGRPNDANIDRLAAQGAKNRTGQTPSWAG
jgi:hypothetical protein